VCVFVRVFINVQRENAFSRVHSHEREEEKARVHMWVCEHDREGDPHEKRLYRDVCVRVWCMCVRVSMRWLRLVGTLKL